MRGVTLLCLLGHIAGDIIVYHTKVSWLQLLVERGKGSKGVIDVPALVSCQPLHNHLVASIP